ncbi:YpoC family protein [Aquibacillus sediminis]|uniref:YpoC family protein n=1 Tax=Aquibacillus sediminis TaxID=2574734 RepID=UPI0011080E8C|nr:hypothetical protein [Aquibacillus sediminis]
MFDKGKQYIAEWKRSKDTIATLYNERKYKDAVEPMLQQVTAFKKALYEVNKKNDSSRETFQSDVKDFSYKPMNVTDRVTFIEENPEQYHCYIQLNELFMELEKIYARAEIMEARNS